MEIQVQEAGTTVVIDHEQNTIGTRYTGQDKPSNIYSLDETWLQDLIHCRQCGKLLEDEVLAFAFWKLEASVCDSTCYSLQVHKRFACCEQAVRTNCVCTYSTTCPVHGERHIGTHD